jgi:hypothetical protein
VVKPGKVEETGRSYIMTNPDVTTCFSLFMDQKLGNLLSHIALDKLKIYSPKLTFLQVTRA